MHVPQAPDGVIGGNRRPALLQPHAPGVPGRFKVERRAVFRLRLLQSTGTGVAGAVSRDDRLALRARAQLRASERQRLGPPAALCGTPQSPLAPSSRPSTRGARAGVDDGGGSGARPLGQLSRSLRADADAIVASSADRLLAFERAKAATPLPFLAARAALMGADGGATTWSRELRAAATGWDGDDWDDDGGGPARAAAAVVSSTTAATTTARQRRRQRQPAPPAPVSTATAARPMTAARAAAPCALCGLCAGFDGVPVHGVNLCAPAAAAAAAAAAVAAPTQRDAECASQDAGGGDGASFFLTAGGSPDAGWRGHGAGARNDGVDGQRAMAARLRSEAGRVARALGVSRAGGPRHKPSVADYERSFVSG